MLETPKKQYDLEERTFIFARDVALWCISLSKDLVNIQYIKQVVRSSGSVGANYIEANESLSKKDFLMRIKICRKEAKESQYWLQLFDIAIELEPERKGLIQEALELRKIFGAIVEKSQI